MLLMLMMMGLFHFHQSTCRECKQVFRFDINSHFSLGGRSVCFLPSSHEPVLARPGRSFLFFVWGHLCT